MKFCPQCGKELNEGAKFCPSCGFRIVAPQNEFTSPEPVYTPPPTPSPPQTYQPQQPVNYQSSTYNQSYLNPSSGQTGILQRAIRIISNPKQEWLEIGNEIPVTRKLVWAYAFVLALIPAISSFVAYGMIGVEQMGMTIKSIPVGMTQGLTQLVSAILGVYLLAWVIDKLAPSYSSEQNYGRSLQLAVYSTTAQWLAGVFLLIDGMRWMTFAAGLYAIYLLITGLPVIKRTPSNRVTGYVVVTIICMLVIGLVLSLAIVSIFGLIFASSSGLGI